MALIPKNLEELRIHLQDPLYRNSYYILLTSGSVSVFGFIFWIIVARLYTPNDVGLATVIFSMSQLISVFSSLGLNYSLVRYYSKRNDKKEMVNTVILTIGIIAFFLSIIFLAGIQFWSPSLIYLQNNYLLLFSFIILTVLSSVFSLQGYVFIAARLVKFSFYQNIIYNILRVPLPFFLLSFGLLGIISSWTLATIIAFLLGSLWFIPKVLPDYKPRPKIELTILKEIMPFSFGNYIAGVLGSLPFQIMPLLIVSILNVENAAYYYIAWSIAGIFTTISSAVTTSLFAEGSQNMETDFQMIIRKSIIFLFILLIPAIIILFVFSDEILLLFGQTYSVNASTLLWFFVISCIPYAINQIYITIKRVQLEIKPMIYVNLTTAILVISGSYILMNIIGLIGVGIAWIFGQGVVALIVSVFLVKKDQSKSLSA
jgi:O-antigen/teichoic acid export membrane protein